MARKDFPELSAAEYKALKRALSEVGHSEAALIRKRKARAWNPLQSQPKNLREPRAKQERGWNTLQAPQNRRVPSAKLHPLQVAQKHAKYAVFDAKNKVLGYFVSWHVAEMVAQKLADANDAAYHIKEV